MSTTRVIYGPWVPLTDADGIQTPVNGTLKQLAPSRFKGYRLKQYTNVDGWEDFEIRATLRGIATTNARMQANVYIDDSSLANTVGVVDLTGNELPLGFMYLDGATICEKVFTLSALQRFSRGFPPQTFAVVVGNTSETLLNQLSNAVAIRGMRHEDVA
jgi:hypothetical protein